jgi:Dolichyl-phosphate-mannose-protein mannosyltransferase
MLLFLIAGVALTIALGFRLRAEGARGRDVAIVGGVALATRLGMAALAIVIGARTHGAGVWLNDEASFWLATEALFPTPWEQSLPGGLDHLAGNGYLGLTTYISLLLGAPSSTAFRLANAALGIAVPLLSMDVARRLFGVRAGLVAGLVVAVWPTLIFWSATMLRDTLASFAVVLTWWTIVSARSRADLRMLCTVALAVVVLTSIRPYLGFSVALGAGLWWAYPLLRAQRARLAVVGMAATLAIAAFIFVGQPQRLDAALHQLMYRQTTTRLETLGLLYRDPQPDLFPQEPPFGRGVAVALVDSDTGWLVSGLVQEPAGPGLVTVSFIDESVRTLPTADLVLLQSAPLAPLQVLSNMWAGVVGFIWGMSSTSDATSPVWIASALAWDVMLLIAVAGGLRGGLRGRDWVFPACVVLGTVAALVVVPGAPGNTDRHRSTQTLPLLVVLASGLLASRGRLLLTPEDPASMASRSPSTQATAAASRMRSAR